MKIKLLLLSALLLSACANSNEDTETIASQDETTEESEEKNLIKYDEVSENRWIDYTGEELNNHQMVLSENISYNSADKYFITVGGYISYFNDDEFIETIRIDNTDREEIPSINDANNIKVSFNKAFIDRIELTKE